MAKFVRIEGKKTQVKFRGLIIGSIIFMIGVAMQVATVNAALFAGGRFVAGFGTGAISSIGPLYQAEISPKHIRGTITAGYHTAKTFGVLLAAIVNNSTKDRGGNSAYLIPIYIQFVWAIILMSGFAFLPESPRYFVKYGKRDKARQALARIRHRDEDDALVTSELDEIEASLEAEHSVGDVSVRDCFKRENRQLYRLILGMTVMAFSQLVGVNFIKYFGTDFFQQAGITNSFVISMATNLVSFSMTIPALYLIERLGRRSFLIIGYIGSWITQYTIAIVGLVAAGSDLARKILVSFSILYIAIESAGVGPPSLVIVGEVFPLRTRAKSIALSLGCDYSWNFIIALTTPYLVDSGPGNANLGTNVFFIWGSCSLLGAIFVYAWVYETKGLSLEQVDELYNSVPFAWQSAGFVPRAIQDENALILELDKAIKPGDTNVSDDEVSADHATDLAEDGIQEIPSRPQQVWSSV
ncbi:general substrate transporter [Lipomyces kononenkoae]|uniref:General substrate transporter n=1 Tax=Lipomyces kononenkoae TaxID=34357 RepID=A0ACC3SUN5_LIPKO